MNGLDVIIGKGRHYNIGEDNPMYGKKLTEETIKKIRLTKLGEKNPIWCGDNVGCNGLHKWVRRNKPQPLFCEVCGKESPFDLASIDNKYTRNLDDWQWLCRKCHMRIDGRLEKFIIISATNRKNTQRDEKGRFIGLHGLSKVRDLQRNL